MWMFMYEVIFLWYRESTSQEDSQGSQERLLWLSVSLGVWPLPGFFSLAFLVLFGIFNLLVVTTDRPVCSRINNLRKSEEGKQHRDLALGPHGVFKGECRQAQASSIRSFWPFASAWGSPLFLCCVGSTLSTLLIAQYFPMLYFFLQHISFSRIIWTPTCSKVWNFWSLICYHNEEKSISWNYFMHKLLKTLNQITLDYCVKCVRCMKNIHKFYV